MFRRFIRYRILYPLIAAFPRRLSYKLATLKGYLDAWLDSKGQRATRAGMAAILGDAPEGRVAEWALGQRRMLAREILDVFWLPRLTAANIDRFIRLTGVEHLQGAVTSGRPVILYSAHFGRLIMPAMALGAKGTVTSCLTTDTSPGLPPGEQRYLAGKLVEMQRLMQGEMVQKRDSLRRLYRILREGRILGVIVDAPPDEGDAIETFPFLGGQARLSTGVVRLTRKSGALLLPYFALEEPGGLCGHILAPFDLEGLDDKAALDRIFQPVEQYIRERPDQWWMWSALAAIWRPDVSPDR